MRKSESFRTSGDIVWSMSASSGSLDRYATARVSDHVLIGGVRHLRQVLASYAAYYNQARTDLALQKDAPLRRSVQRCGQIIAIPILSGLHHQYGLTAMYAVTRSPAFKRGLLELF
jgi:hypothetical protein